MTVASATISVLERALRDLDLHAIGGQGGIDGGRRGRVDVEQGKRQVIDGDRAGAIGHRVGQHQVGGARAVQQGKAVADVTFPDAYGTRAAAAVIDAIEPQGVGGRDGHLFAGRQHVGDAAWGIDGFAGAGGGAAAGQQGQAQPQGQQEGRESVMRMVHMFPFRWRPCLWPSRISGLIITR